MHDFNGHFGGIHFIWWIVWIALVLILIYTLYTIPYRIYNKESPMDILKKRLANGEISKEEFEALKKSLESDE